jgi:uncharacterized protein (TIGR02145 family)
MRNYFFVLFALTLIPFYSYAQMFGGQLKSTKAGSITALNCASATNNGTLTESTLASGVSSVVPYAGGNGGAHNGQIVTSTGVTGLTATLNAGAFANGAGNLTYTITGTPAGSGTASFALSLGGQSCTLSRAVNSAQPQYPVGSVFCNGPTVVVDVTNPATGKIWMDRNLGASQAAISSNDANAYGDLYQWGRRSDGHQCRNSATTTTLSSIDQPAHGNFILVPNSPFDWRSPQNTNLWQGVNGVNNPCPSGYRLPTDLELDAERVSWSNNNAAGAFISPLKLPLAGGRISGTGLIFSVGSGGNYWSSTVSGSNSRLLAFGGSDASMGYGDRASGVSVRCLKDAAPSPQGFINSIDCGNATITGILTTGNAASGVSSSVPYTGGNGGTHNGQTVSSTGVTGLTASLTAGTFANGAGSLTYNITGTPNGSGTATFALNIGGQTCSLSINVLSASTPAYPPNSVFCANGPTSVVEIINPATGRIWMDRNLGASQAAISSNDANAYGDLYQWGRRSDGHQCRTSDTTNTLSSTDQPAHGDFISSFSSPHDWRLPQNDNLWQGVNGVNNPCPVGYRLPSEAELNAERLSWNINNASGANSSPIKLTAAGSRLHTGDIVESGIVGYYCGSTISSINSKYLLFTSTTALIHISNRTNGSSVRCIKDSTTPQGSINSIDCGSATNNGTLTQGILASGVSSSVPYTGGNGGVHNGQTVTSTGVTGLTATLAAGTFANGAGSLTYNITGIPNGSGTATFALSIGGQNCILSRIVNPVYPVGTIHCTTPTAIVETTNPTTGRIWMDRNLGAQQVAASSADQNAYGDLYQWGRRADGHQCRNSQNISTSSATDQPPHGFFIVANTGNFDWRSPQNGSLWQGVNGINNPCPTGYRIPTLTEWNAERSTWFSNNSFGALVSPLKLPNTGTRIQANGMLNFIDLYGYYWSSSIGVTDALGLYFGYANNSASNFSSGRGTGCAVRCIKDNTSSPQGSINTIDCGSATNNGTLTQGTLASGVSSLVPYTGGNGGAHNGQTVTSTGVTGLTATLAAGTFANGAGSLTYYITGTPSSSGTANFALNIGGQSCSLSINVLSASTPVYPPNSVFCANGPTSVVDVTNPTTGRIWMDRNLGATQVATSSNDANAYGDLYQWGRRSDGHQCRTSDTTNTLSSTDQPTHGNFILAPNAPYDWRNPQNTNLWQGVSGLNNPCPTGYRLPTYSEWESEFQSWMSPNSFGAFQSVLKLTLGGNKNSMSGEVFNEGILGHYWSSNNYWSVSHNFFGSEALYFSDSVNWDFNGRANAASLRCIKD